MPRLFDIFCLPSVPTQARDPPDQRLRDRKHAALRDVVFVRRRRVDAAVDVIEPARDLAAHLDVRVLILADRHELGAEREDVGALADRVEREAEAVVIAEVLRVDLRLQRRVAHDPVERQEHREVPGQLRDRRDLGLEHERRALGVDADREPVLHDLERVAPDVVRLLRARRERVHVRDQEVAVVLVLEAHAIFERADPVAEVKSARRGIAGEDARRLVTARTLPQLGEVGLAGVVGAPGRGRAGARWSSRPSRSCRVSLMRWIELVSLRWSPRHAVEYLNGGGVEHRLGVRRLRGRSTDSPLRRDAAWVSVRPRRGRRRRIAGRNTASTIVVGRVEQRDHVVRRDEAGSATQKSNAVS